MGHMLSERHQVEAQVGSSSKILPCCPLQDNQVLVVQDAEVMITIKGYGCEGSPDSSLTADMDFPPGIPAKTTTHGRSSARSV